MLYYIFIEFKFIFIRYYYRYFKWLSYNFMLNTWYFNLWLLIIYCYHYLLNIQFDLSIHESYLYRFLVLFNFKDYGRIGSSRGTVPPILCLRLLTLVTLKFTLLSLVTVHYILKKLNRGSIWGVHDIFFSRTVDVILSGRLSPLSADTELFSSGVLILTI